MFLPSQVSVYVYLWSWPFTRRSKCGTTSPATTTRAEHYSVNAWVSLPSQTITTNTQTQLQHYRTESYWEGWSYLCVCVFTKVSLSLSHSHPPFLAASPDHCSLAYLTQSGKHFVRSSLSQYDFYSQCSTHTLQYLFYLIKVYSISFLIHNFMSFLGKWKRLKTNMTLKMYTIWCLSAAKL